MGGAYKYVYSSYTLTKSNFYRLAGRNCNCKSRQIIPILPLNLRVNIASSCR